MTTREEKLKAREAVLKKLHKEQGKESVNVYKDMDNIKVECIPTGSLSLDVALGGGLPRGRIIEIFGPNSNGKTTLALHCVAQAQAMGGLAAFIDAEHALDPVYAERLGVNMDDLTFSQPNNGEQALEIVKSLVESGAYDIIIVDSVSALTPKKEVDGEIGDSHVGLQARMMSQGLRMLAPLISKSKTIVVFLNQIRMKIGVMYGSPETTPGGEALKFYASQRIDIRKVTALKEGDEVVGFKTRCKIVKNKVAPPMKTCEFDIVSGQGIDKLGEILDKAIELVLVEKTGAWFKIDGVNVGHGRVDTINYLRENQEVRERIVNQVMGLCQKTS